MADSGGIDVHKEKFLKCSHGTTAIKTKVELPIGVERRIENIGVVTRSVRKWGHLIGR
jgi:hypothetical protein